MPLGRSQSLIEHLTSEWKHATNPEHVCITPNEWSALCTDSHFLLYGGVMFVVSALSWTYGDQPKDKKTDVAWNLLVIRSPSLFRAVNGFLACMMTYEAIPHIACHEYVFGGLLIWLICMEIWMLYGLPYIKSRAIAGYESLTPEADTVNEWVQKGTATFDADTFYVNIAKSNFEIVLVFLAHLFAFLVWYVQLLHIDARATLDTDAGSAYFLASCIMLPIMEPIVNGNFGAKQDVFKSIRGFMDANPGKKFTVYGKNARGRLTGGGWEITRARNVYFRELLCFWVNAVSNTFQFITLPILMASSPDFYTLVIGIGGSAMMVHLNGCESTAITIEPE